MANKDDQKNKALAAALGQIEKQFGKGSVMRLGEDGINKDIEAISTGSSLQLISRPRAIQLGASSLNFCNSSGSIEWPPPDSGFSICESGFGLSGFSDFS